MDQTQSETNKSASVFSTPVVQQGVPGPSYGYQKPKRNWSLIIVLLGILFIPFCCCGSIILSAIFDSSSLTSAQAEYQYAYGDSSSDNKFLSLKIDGPIMTDGNPNDPFAGVLYSKAVYGYAIKRSLVKAADDSSIKGIILEINSPGGTVVGSKAISDGVAYYKEQTGNPVYAYVQDMAASGGYWAAASADRIVMEAGSLTGSIGVILGPFEYYDQLVSLGSVGTTGGIEFTYITGGTYKDLGNPVRRLSSEEKTVLQTQVSNEYDMFVKHVATGRKIPETKVRNDIKALIYGVKDAITLGLVDEEGTQEQTYDKLATAARVSDYQVIQETYTGSIFDALLSSFIKKETISVETSCILCGQMLYLHGNPLDYKVVKE